MESVPSITDLERRVTAEESDSDQLTVVRSSSGLKVVDDLQDTPRPAEDEPFGSQAAPAAPISGQSVRDRYQTLAWKLAATDAAILFLALSVAWVVRWGLRPVDLSYSLVLVAGPMLWALVFRGFGLHTPQHVPAAEEFRRTIGATSLGMLTVAVASFWSEASLSRGWVALSWMIALVLELVVRHAWRVYQARLKSDGRLSFRTLVIGTNHEAGRIVEALRLPQSGFAPLGYLSTGGAHVSPDGLSVIGTLDRLDDAIRRYAVDCVFVASSTVGAEGMLQVVQAARRHGAEVRVSANLPEILSSRLTVQQIGTAMALTIKPVRLTGSQTVVKRMFDVTVASTVLLLTVPITIAVALAVRLTSRGRALFSQPRVTKGGATFRMHKFRTMVKDAHAITVETSPDSSQLFFKPENDPRITKVGNFLRRTSLDELPQLINVIKGEMSLVGPRPLPTEQVAANLELLSSRHEVPAGCTGWWQINGRSNLAPDQALRLDLFYIENWSLTLDLYILLKTVGVLLARRGAY